MTAIGTALTSTSRSQEPTGFLNRTIEVEGVPHRYQVYVPAEYTRERRWPVILFLHGSGERGTDGLLQTSIGLGEGIRRHAERWPAIVVFPQAPPAHRWHGRVAHLALAALDRTVREFSIDPDRVYLVGLSAGGTSPTARPSVSPAWWPSAAGCSPPPSGASRPCRPRAARCIP